MAEAASAPPGRGRGRPPRPKPAPQPDAAASGGPQPAAASGGPQTDAAGSDEAASGEGQSVAASVGDAASRGLQTIAASREPQTVAASGGLKTGAASGGIDTDAVSEGKATSGGLKRDAASGGLKADASAGLKPDAASQGPQTGAARGGEAANGGPKTDAVSGEPTGGSEGGGGGAITTSYWPCKTGGLVKVLHQAPASSSSRGSSSSGSGPRAYQMQVVLEEEVPAGSTVELHWGVYRSSPQKWQHPESVVPAGSERDERSGAMRTAMQEVKAADSDSGSTHSITLSVPASLAPLTVAFVIQVKPPPAVTSGSTASGSTVSGSTASGSPTSGSTARPRFVTPLRGRHFSALIGCGAGSNLREGATLLHPPASSPQQQATAGQRGQPAQALSGQAVNFAVRCRGAERVCLVLLRPKVGPASPAGAPVSLQQQLVREWGMMEIVLDPVLNRSGELWHIEVEGLRDLAGLCFGWRLEGDVSWESGCRVQPDLLLLDPCCPSLRYFSLAAADLAPVPLPTLTLPDGTEAAAASSLEGLAAEAWVREQRQGAAPTAEAAVAAQVAAGGAFVAGPRHPLEELRLMELDVRTFAQGKGVLHPGSFLGVGERAGHIKAVGANAVLLTPSYATARGIGLLSRAAVHFMAADPELAADPASRTSSAAAAADFRRMVSVLHSRNIEVLLEFELTFTAEGTDNHPTSLSLRGLDYSTYYRRNGVINCGHASTRQYLLQVLHFWAAEGVDGFCFVNAENLVLDREGTVLDAPPLADALCHDPVLRHLKLVALPSDDSLLPRGGKRGFPHWALWQQRNTAFGADLVAYMLEGAAGMLTTVAGRLTGSANIFDADWDAGLPGNLAAARRPAFGMNSVTVLGRQSLAELSAEAAETALAAAEAAHTYGAPGWVPPPSPATISKSLLALTILALGVPIIPQDTVAELAEAHFVGVLMRVRPRLAALLLPLRFDSLRDIRWHAADAAVTPIWDADSAIAAIGAGHRSANFLGFSVYGVDGQAVYVGINPHFYPVSATLPPPPVGRVWERVVDTSLPPPEDALLEGGEPLSAGTYDFGSKAVMVMQTAVMETAGWEQAALGAQQQPQQPLQPQAQQQQLLQQAQQRLLEQQRLLQQQQLQPPGGSGFGM